MSQTTTNNNASAAMQAQQDQSILSYELEITPQSSKKAYLRMVKDILNLNPCMRSTVAEMIRTRGYDAHIGGRHVAVLVLGKTIRLGYFTGNSPDFR